MKTIISLIQIILGILLVLIIIIQQKGSGLGSSFGGGADMSFYRTKRGAEKFLFYGTIGISLAFILFSLIGLLV